MFRNVAYSNVFSILNSVGLNPLRIWANKIRGGHIKRITDEDIQGLVIEIVSTNVKNTYITCPGDANITLGIKMPFFIVIVKNLNKEFSFEIQVLDNTNIRRRFHASNRHSTARVKPMICNVPLHLTGKWNHLHINLPEYTQFAYGTEYVETLRVQIHPNCRIRRVFFSDRYYEENELPGEFKLYLPIKRPEVHPLPQTLQVAGKSASNSSTQSSVPK